MTLTVRSATVTDATTKGSALTHAELDENFNHLRQSSNHSFTQSGTAPSSRTMQAKAREIERTPQDHGAVADGSTDDRTAFANAITSQDAASNGEVKVPAETYKLTTGLTMPTLNDLVGEGRWASRLEFALTATGTCISLEGVDTNNRVRSSLRKMRIDGTNCTDSAVTGVKVNWNQQQQPLLDEVTIYGGYESGGASTGLKYGLVFTEDGSNWITSIDHLGIEGCHTDALVMDTASGGAHNIINFNDCRFENNKGRNVYIVGPNDDIATAQINFYGCTFESASYQTTGVTADVHIEGVVNALLEGCYFESSASPNWPTYELYVPSGRVNLHSCNIAWAQTGIYCGGEVTITGKNTIRTSTAGIHIPTGGTCNIEGEAVTFLGAGTPITYAGTGTLNWNRSKIVKKTSNYTITTADIGCKFSSEGTQQDITLTLPDAPTGSHLTIVTGATSLRNTAWRWVASGSGTNEYYLELAAGGNPGFSEPATVYDFTTSLTNGTLGALTAGQWDYGDNDTLGFSTIYVRLSDGADPDSRSANSVIAGYNITVTPNASGRRIAPQGGTPTDSMISDGAVGTSVTLRSYGTTFWQMEAKSGTWT
jgi:hypothetical protein